MLLCKKNNNMNPFDNSFYQEELYYQEGKFYLRKIGGCLSPVGKIDVSVLKLIGGEVVEELTKEDAFILADIYCDKKFRRSNKFRQIFDYNTSEMIALKNQIIRNKREIKAMNF